MAPGIISTKEKHIVSADKLNGVAWKPSKETIHRLLHGLTSTNLRVFGF
jgi:hypothetical protein